jgi:flagellar hook-length control protein FliK
MSNLAMANLTAAASPGQQEAAKGKSSVAKHDSTSVKTTQNDSGQQVATSKESVDAGTSSGKTVGKFSFNDLLKKRLTHDTSNDPTDTSQSRKQTIVNTEVTSDKKSVGEKTKKQSDNLVPVISYMPQALQATKMQPVTAVTNNANSFQNKTLKMVQLTKTQAIGPSTPVESTKTVAGKEVKATKSTAKESKPFSVVEQKTVKTDAEIKDASITPKLENTSKNAVSAQNINISQQKQESAPNTVNLSADLNTAGKDTLQLTYSQSQVHDSTEVTKTDIRKTATPKTQEKVQVSTATEASEVTQTVISASTRQAEMVTQVPTRHAGTEHVSATLVTTASSEKAAVGQAVLTPSEQIIDKVQNTITGSTQQIQVTLSPAELGMVRITFRQQDGQMEGLLEVQNPEVRKDVEKALPQITAALAQNGIQLRRMDIAPMENQQQPNQGAFQSPQQEFTPADQHYLTGQGNSGGTGNSGGRAFGQDVQLTDGVQGQARQGFDLSGLNMYA